MRKLVLSEDSKEILKEHYELDVALVFGMITGDDYIDKNINYYAFKGVLAEVIQYGNYNSNIKCKLQNKLAKDELTYLILVGIVEVVKNDK